MWLTQHPTEGEQREEEAGGGVLCGQGGECAGLRPLVALHMDLHWPQHCRSGNTHFVKLDFLVPNDLDFPCPTKIASNLALRNKVMNVSHRLSTWC